MTFRTVLIPNIILILHRRIIFNMVPWILKLLLLTTKISSSRIGNYFNENCAWPVFSRSIFLGSYRSCERNIYNPGNLWFGLLIPLVSKSLHRKASISHKLLREASFANSVWNCFAPKGPKHSHQGANLDYNRVAIVTNQFLESFLAITYLVLEILVIEWSSILPTALRLTSSFFNIHRIRRWNCCV